MRRMVDKAAAKRGFDFLKRRRLRALRLLSKGLSQAEVARRVGVRRQSVNRWSKQLADSDLMTTKPPGRKPLLDASDLRRLEASLESGARACGYRTNGWTTPRMATFIEKLCGVKYTTVQAWRIVHKLGWSYRNHLWYPPEQGKAAPGRLKKGRLRKPRPKKKSKRIP